MRSLPLPINTLLGHKYCTRLHVSKSSKSPKLCQVFFQTSDVFTQLGVAPFLALEEEDL